MSMTKGDRCMLCGNVRERRSCKLICARCGYTTDCEDGGL